MASDAHSAWSVPLGLLSALLASFGVLDFAGCFDDAEPTSVVQLSLTSLRPRLLQAGAAGVLWVLTLRGAVAGVLPLHAWLAPLLVTLSSAALLAALSRLASLWATPGTPLRDQPGFWLLLLGVVLYVPLLGSYSLLDPWEAHYGEVTREMLARDDWLSLWWAQEGWFWSKPVFDFWLQGVSFSLTGVRFMPDQMLAGAGAGLAPAPEWAARLPIFLLTVIASYLLYKAVAKAFGARAGFLSGLVLSTAPYWYLIAHQSMTDMPYVAPLTAALALVVLGMRTDPDVTVQNFELAVGARVLRVSA